MLKDKEVEMHWHPSNKEYYTNKGYIFTKMKDIFYVKVEDLNPRSSVSVNAFCDYCGQEYLVDYNWYYKSITTGIKKCACQKCHGKKAHENHVIERAEKWFGKLQSLCDKLDYKLITKKSEFTSSEMQIKYICPKHGTQTQAMCVLLDGHYCRDCSYEKRKEAKKTSKKILISTVESIDGNRLLNPDDYINAFIPNLKIQCKCGEIFTVSYDNYRFGATIRCKRCTKSESNGEYCIRKYLSDHDIEFIPQYCIKECRDKKPLPFDFYISDWNLLIEFDGEQHYRPIFGNKSYEQTIYHDKIKTAYCEQNNILLLRIPYWERNHIGKILDKEFEKYR